MLSGEDNGFPHFITIFLTRCPPCNTFPILLVWDQDCLPCPPASKVLVFWCLCTPNIKGILYSWAKDNALVKISWDWSCCVLNFYQIYSVMSLKRKAPCVLQKTQQMTIVNAKWEVQIILNQTCYLLSLSLFGRYLISLDWLRQLCDTGLWKIKSTKRDALYKKRSGSQSHNM